VSPSVVARLHEKSGAARWDVSVTRLHGVIEVSMAHAFAGKNPSTREIDRYIEALHIGDLVLTCACADGHEAAWAHFIGEYRPALYRAADAIDPTGGARDLADALYGELFGLREGEDGERLSLFRYFHGRSSLATWLRAVLSQRHVDRLRACRRVDPLPEPDAAAIEQTTIKSPDPERPRYVAAMRNALAAAIAALPPRDRLRLGLYYREDLTLAAIGRLLKEHEATVSRQLARTRQTIRDDVERRLRQQHGLDDAALAECFQSVVDDAGSLDLAELLTPLPVRKIGGEERS
jgi:RNA polymerase sigma-70 factor